MFSMILSAAVIGVEAKAVQVEADVCDGLPMFCMVGDLSTEVREAADRVRTALRNTGIAVPPKRVTVNLSPAHIRKEGTRYDLPVAAALLAALGVFPGRICQKYHDCRRSRSERAGLSGGWCAADSTSGAGVKVQLLSGAESQCRGRGGGTGDVGDRD